MIQGVQPGANQRPENKPQRRAGAGQTGHPPLLFAADTQTGQRHDRRHAEAQAEPHQQYRKTHHQLPICQPQNQRAGTQRRDSKGNQQRGRCPQPLHHDNLAEQGRDRRRHHGQAKGAGCRRGG